jgi:hypothetical protein
MSENNPWYNASPKFPPLPIEVHVSRHTVMDAQRIQPLVDEEVKRLREELGRIREAASRMEYEVQGILGGYLYGYSSDGLPLWGDHCASSLAQETINRLKKAEDEVASLKLCLELNKKR